MFPRPAARGGSRFEESPQGLLAPLERLGVRLVVNERPAPGRPHEAGIAQDPQVLRYGALRDAKLSGQRPHTERAAGDQLEDAQAHLDSQRPQETRDFRNVFHGPTRIQRSVQPPRR